MKVKIIYSKAQIKAAGDFIATHNPYFKDQHSFIESLIWDYITELSKNFPHNHQFVGTMGFTIFTSIDSVEGIDSDNNVLTIEVLVDPAVGNNQPFEEKDFDFARPDVQETKED